MNGKRWRRARVLGLAGQKVESTRKAGSPGPVRTIGRRRSATLGLFAVLVAIATAAAPAAADASYSATVLADNPVSYWRLGETSGTVAVDQRSANAGAYVNTPTLAATSLLATDTANKAVGFDGTNDHVKVPNSAGLQLTSAVSLEAWIKPTSLPASGSFRSILTKAETYSLQFNGPQLEFTIMQAGVRKRVQAPVGAIVAGQTYHVVGTYNGSAQRLYVNGVQVAIAALSGAATTNTNALFVGSWSATQEFFNGTIDDAAVYNTVLSASRIAAHYEAGSGKVLPPSYSSEVLADNPVSYWRLGETSGTTAVDERAANAGTYTNAPTLGATSLLATETANKAVTFDGTNDHVRVSNSAGLQLTTSVSLEAWIKPTSLPASGSFRSILTKAESYALQFNGPRLEFTIMQAGVRKRVQAPEGAIVAGQTYHVVGTYGVEGELGFQNLYVNGVQVATASLSGAATTNTNALFIGSWNATQEFFNGTIDDAAVYGTVLSASRIAAHYEVGADPPTTTITSPQPTYTSGEKAPITFTSDEAGSTFKCSLDGANPPTTPCTSPYSLPAGLEFDSGWHTFRVVATDPQGNTAVIPTSYIFNLGIYPPTLSANKLTSPEEGRKSSHYYTLKAQWGEGEAAGVTGVTYQMKLPYWDEFRTIPAEFVLDGEGKQVKWPLATTGSPGHADPVFFDYLTAVKTKGWALIEEDIKFRAAFDGTISVAGASEPVTTEFLYTHGGVGAPTDASAQIGPASLDLLTGQYTISRTDVSIPVPGSESNLEFTRTYESNYRNQKVGSMVMGGMWQPSGPMEQAYQGQAWRELRERHQDFVPAQYDKECEEEEGAGNEVCMVEESIPAADWIELLDNEGGEAAFEISGGKYITPEYMSGYALTKQGSGASTTFELAASDGVSTLFVKNDAGIEGSYRPASVSWQATAKSARLVYEHLEGTGEYRLTKMIAPSAVTCTNADSIKTAGCRTLTFQYFSCSCGGWTRLSSITYYTATPSPEVEKNNVSQEVAKYEYDANYRLIAEWDPRISPALKETYTYGTWVNYKMTSLTPPGEEPWQFSYYKSGEFTPEGGFYKWKDAALFDRLKSVSRASLLTSPTTATTTIAYQVPVSGGGAPYDMSPSTVAKWGQTDYPVDATAVFPPTQVPSSPRPIDFSQATVHYLDPEGNEVNTASPAPPGVAGDRISTSEIDFKGNVVRSLTPQNRLTALAAGDTVARSKELDSHSTYNADGTRMLESWGPLHKVRLESGETKEARTHTTIEYDVGFVQTTEEKAAGTPLPNLPTKETTAAAIPGEADKEPRVTETKYDWLLKAPIESIIDPGSEPGHLNLITKTVYNSAGQVKERRQPSNTAGGTAGTTRTVYYSAGANADQVSCGNKAAWAGLPCVTYPAADPSPAESNPKLPWTWTTKYSSLDQPEEVQEKTNGVLKRTTTTTYDSAGRVTKAKQTGAAGESASVPAVEPTYSTTTGAVTAQRFKCESPESCTVFDTQEVKTTYDKLGRPEEYEDADGGKSKTTYDLMGRVVLASDGKGGQALVYDEASGALVELVDSAAGTFTAEYNADGKMTEQLLPNGLAQQITYDETGTAVSLRYQKESYCSSGCTWLQFSQEKSIRGQVVKQESNLTGEEYSYDKAGRLTLAKQTPNLAGCTTRAYAYDKNANRTSVTTRAPKEGGACDTTSTGTKQSSTYDTADRLIGSGIVYDSLGRMTALPSTHSGGGTLSTSYYVNNQIKSQVQDGLTNTYELDSAGRQRKRTRSGSQSGTEVYHYAGGSDTPAWIQEGANWTRNVSALGGALGAVQQSSGDVTLQLADMHGDVVATADIDPTETKLLSTQSFDEFGTPLQAGVAKFGWLGSKGRRTELPSGVIQMGVRSYVPEMGRFISPDPVRGGSANAYDYSNADPVNQFDFGGEKPYSMDTGVQGCSLRLRMWSHHRGRMNVRITYYCPKKAWKLGHAQGKLNSWNWERHKKGILSGIDKFETFTPTFTSGGGSVARGNCRDIDPCQRSIRRDFEFECESGREYQVTGESKKWYGPTAGAHEWVILKVAAQQHCL